MTVRRRGLAALGGPANPCLVVSPHPVPVVRFELADSTHSFLTSELRQWEWLAADARERVRIRTASGSILVAGQNLLPLRNALDQLRLHIVREIAGRGDPGGTQPWVERITLEQRSPPSLP